MTGATIDLMKIDYDETVGVLHNAAAKSKLKLKEKVDLLAELKTQSKSSARIEKREHSAQITAKNLAISKLEKEYQGRMNFMVITCAQLVDSHADASVDAFKSQSNASNVEE